MSESPYKNVFNLGDYRKKNLGPHQDHLSITQDGYFNYPEDGEVLLTPEDALQVAEAVIDTYEREGALLQNYTELEIARLMDSSLSVSNEVLNANYQDSMQHSLEEMVEQAQSFTTESLRRVLTLYKKRPRSLYGTYAYAVACELKKRLSGQDGHNETPGLHAIN